MVWGGRIGSWWSKLMWIMSDTRFGHKCLIFLCEALSISSISEYPGYLVNRKQRGFRFATSYRRTTVKFLVRFCQCTLYVVGQKGFRGVLSWRKSVSFASWQAYWTNQFFMTTRIHSANARAEREFLLTLVHYIALWSDDPLLSSTWQKSMVLRFK